MNPSFDRPGVLRGYVRGSDGLYYKRDTYGASSVEILVRDERGRLLRVQHIAMGDRDPACRTRELVEAT
jgi:hypothetical protein